MAYKQVDFLLTPFVDANGDPLVGGRVFFYEAGTTTPKTVYSTSSGTGPFPEKDFEADGTLLAYVDGFVKIVIKNASMAVVHTYDNLDYSQVGSGVLTNYLPRNGSLAMTGTLPMNSNDISNAGNISVVVGKALKVEHGGLIAVQDPNDILIASTATGYGSLRFTGSNWHITTDNKVTHSTAPGFFTEYNADSTAHFQLKNIGATGVSHLEINNQNMKVFDATTTATGLYVGSNKKLEVSANACNITVPTYTTSSISVGTTLQAFEINLYNSANTGIQFNNSFTGALGTDGSYIIIDATKQLNIVNRENADIAIGTDGYDCITCKTGQRVTIGIDSTTTIPSTLNILDDTDYSGLTVRNTISNVEFAVAADATTTTIGNLSNHPLDIVVNNTNVLECSNATGAVKAPFYLHSVNAGIVGTDANTPATIPGIPGDGKAYMVHRKYVDDQIGGLNLSSAATAGDLIYRTTSGGSGWTALGLGVFGQSIVNAGGGWLNMGDGEFMPLFIAAVATGDGSGKNIYNYMSWYNINPSNRGRYQLFPQGNAITGGTVFQWMYLQSDSIFKLANVTIQGNPAGGGVYWKIRRSTLICENVYFDATNPNVQLYAEEGSRVYLRECTGMATSNVHFIATDSTIFSKGGIFGQISSNNSDVTFIVGDSVNTCGITRLQASYNGRIKIYHPLSVGATSTNMSISSVYNGNITVIAAQDVTFDTVEVKYGSRLVTEGLSAYTTIGCVFRVEYGSVWHHENTYSIGNRTFTAIVNHGSYFNWNVPNAVNTVTRNMINSSMTINGTDYASWTNNP